VNKETTPPGPRPLAPGPGFLLTGGGTGGHVIPALAVGRELRRRGHAVFFVGTQRGIEGRLVPAEGFELKKVEVGGLNRVGLRQKILTMLRLPLTVWQCRSYVKQAAAVFSMGGYVAGPATLAALISRVPLVVMEPNAVPGFTNRAIGRWVSRALISFSETARFFPAGRTELTGLPVRDEFFQLPPKPRGEVFHLLITGGSQGSRTLNRAARESWPLFRNSGMKVRIVHQTGAAGFEETRDEFAKTGLDGEVVRFITDMPAAFAAADLVVCRSGAGAVSELCAAGKPSVLAPFPFAADDHQTRNAEAMQRNGAAVLTRDQDLTGERLFAAVSELAASNGALERMAEAARKMARPGAAARAADVLEEVGNIN
jgi:UDP-N-acetylglucosamine--N-acetylmuramyl-(pentapeptide) pyrophosphoryl-undecaprenol N-acetylglucosamine transferase